MIKLPLGTLVKVLVNVDLLDGCSVCIGDLGIVIDNEPSISIIHKNRYNYKILVNDCEILVFSEEIQSIV